MRDIDSTLSLFQQHTEQLHTALKSLQTKLERVEMRERTSETILSNISDALIFINRQGLITHFNRAASYLFHLKELEVVGTPYEELFEDNLFGFSMKKMLSEQCEQKQLILTLVQEKKSVQVEIRTSLIKNEGVIITLRDRSEINKLEKSVQQNERLKELGEMAATIAHEIRNPLGGIEGFASLLKRDLKDQPAQRKMVEAVLEGTHLLNTLVTNVLTYAKPCLMEFTSLNLKKSILSMLLHLAPNQQRQIEIHCPEELTLIADEQHFKRALLNLVKNALEASGPKKKVNLLTEEGELLIVEDQGAGIPKESLSKVFSPFFTTKSQGTGLGLSEVIKIIKAHDFDFTIDSSEKGTRAIIHFGAKKCL